MVSFYCQLLFTVSTCLCVTIFSIKGYDFCCEFFHLRVWHPWWSHQGQWQSAFDKEIPWICCKIWTELYQQPTPPQRSCLHWKVTEDYKECAQQVCWRWLRSRPGLIAVKSQFTWQENAITWWTAETGSWKPTSLQSLDMPPVVKLWELHSILGNTTGDMMLILQTPSSCLPSL